MSPSKERQPLGLPPSSNAPHSPTPHPSATTQTEPPTRNNEEELKPQIAITKNTKKRHKEDVTQLGKLREQVVKREGDLKRLSKERTAKLQAMEKEVADLEAANTEATQ